MITPASKCAWPARPQRNALGGGEKGVAGIVEFAEHGVGEETVYASLGMGVEPLRLARLSAVRSVIVLVNCIVDRI